MLRVGKKRKLAECFSIQVVAMLIEKNIYID